MEEKSNKKAVLILGIVSIVISIIPLLGILAIIPAIISIVFTIINIKNKNNINIVGFILSILAIFFIVLWIGIIFLSNKNVNNTELERKLNECYEQIKELSQEEKQKEIRNEINELEKEKNNVKTEIDNLNLEKQNIEQNIEKLKGDIITLKSNPKNYPAGYLVAGTDFEAGRYKIYNGKSNFIVYSSSGQLKVNIILGNNFGLGVDEYIYNFNYGDKVQAESSFTMVAVN